MTIQSVAGRILRRIAVEPVLLGAAVLATFEAVWPAAPAAAKLAVGAWVALGQRALSRPVRSAEEDVQAARQWGAAEGEARARRTPSVAGGGGAPSGASGGVAGGSSGYGGWSGGSGPPGPSGGGSGPPP